jgi:hypothetical protein
VILKRFYRDYMDLKGFSNVFLWVFDDFRRGCQQKHTPEAWGLTEYEYSICMYLLVHFTAGSKPVSSLKYLNL